MNERTIEDNCIKYKVIYFFYGAVFSTLICVLFILGYLYILKHYYSSETNEIPGTEINANIAFDKLSAVCSLISENYYYDVCIQEEALFDGIIASLKDQYSVYYTKEEYESMKQELSGVYYGIGIVLTYDDLIGQYVVKEIQEDSDAYNEISIGDYITGVNGEPIASFSIMDVEKLIGESNQNITISVNNGEKEVICRKKEISRDTVFFEKKGDVGYLRISDFSNRTFIEYSDYKDDIFESKALVIDLRNNLGGSLEESIKVLQDLMPDGKIVSLENKNKEVIEYKSNGLGYKNKVIILVNEDTASAAEVFAAAFKENGYAELVGTNTYGKGIVQTFFEMYDGSALKLTTAVYYTPNNNIINCIGINPDYIISDPDEQLDKALQLTYN